MDIITQGLLGSAVAVSGAKQSEIKHAALIGGLAGLLADADVLIRSDSDPLLTIDFHRHFTHALIFIPVGALIAACLIWLGYRLRTKSELKFSRIYYYSFLGYMLSGVLDACTSYGTHLYWPFSDERIAWSIVSIVDPIFSGLLLLGLIVTLKTRLLHSVRVGLSLCAVYLLFSVTQSQMAEQHITRLAFDRGHDIERIVVKPTFGNVFLWRTVYLSNGSYYIDAVHTLLNQTLYEGVSISALDIGNDFPQLEKDSKQYQDIIRFNRFSDGFLVEAPDQPNLIGDIRYSIFPISARPLWGIVINPEKPDTHVEYVTSRENNQEQRSLFIDMVLGRSILN